ncbi:hypothetical protein Pan241w_38590 [Gimesia alba]|uniref:Uncharacterized protein n=1 Tax=Gimesia alba TaxID=2527973 RepID=A0A517RIP8_9PLAN|nr:hypothetical protein Pan241w_38590 [Gimesia alba]
MFCLYVLNFNLCCFDTRYLRSCREGVNGGLFFLFYKSLMKDLSCSVITRNDPINALRCRVMRGADSEPLSETWKKSCSNEGLLWGADSQGRLFPVHKPVLLARPTLSPHSRERRVTVQIEFFSQYSVKEHEYQPVSSITYA